MGYFMAKNTFAAEVTFKIINLVAKLKVQLILIFYLKQNEEIQLDL